MEGNGDGFLYFYHQRLLDGFGAEAGGVSPAPSSAGVEGGGTPALSPQSAVAAAVGRTSAPAPATPAVEPVRRKRGRPRKYGAASSSPSPPPSASSAAPSFSAPCLSTTSGLGLSKASSSPSLALLSPSSPRVGPGRKKAQRESVGKRGQGFTPHFLTVAAGEDVVQQIMSFVQQQRRAVCIISASGTISSVILRQPAMSGGHMTYEGHFDIITLSGSFLLSETGGAYSRTGVLSVSLSDEHCIVGGGVVSGPLVAAGPVQVLALSFLIGSDTNLAAPANMENAVSNVTTPFPAGTDVSSTECLWSTADSTGRMSTNSVAHSLYQSTGGSGSSLVLQPRAAHVMPSPSSTDLRARVESGHPGGAFSSPGANEHIHE